MSLFSRVLSWSAPITERRGGAALRDELLAGVRGRVLEVGAGTGVMFSHYPPAVTRVIAVEPEPELRAAAGAAARAVGGTVSVEVVDGRAEALAFADASFDAVVCSSVLCSVADPAAVLAELARVLAPGGELRFFEHVASPRPRAALAQRAVDRGGAWRRVMGGCEVARDTESAIRAAFVVTAIRRFAFVPIPLHLPVAPKILGRAVTRRG